MKETGLFSQDINDSDNNFSAKERELLNKGNLKDYNDLANLLAVNRSNEGTFKIDLFGANERNNDDDNYIIIERDEKSNIKKKYENTFQLNKDNNKDDNDEDDLLDLMDSVTGQK